LHISSYIYLIYRVSDSTIVGVRDTTTIWRMRLKRGITAGMAAAAAGLALAACGTTSAPHSAALTAASSSASKTAKTPSPTPIPTATHATQAAAAQTLPAAGNPNGHVFVPRAARAVNTSHPNHVIGNGTPASCTSAAVVRAVAKGGVITFNCGPNPVTITMAATAKVVNTSHRVVLDGGNRVTLSGGGKHQILYMNTCDKKQIWTTDDCFDQEWPQLIVQNLTFEDGYSAVQQTATSFYGGGAIYAEGGQFKVVNSQFIDNRCFRSGPDLGGAAIRALAEWRNRPVYITRDTFRGGVCSNGGALSSIDVNWDVYNSLMINNRAVGFGANPAQSGTPGGGSGGAIYTDGDNYNVLIAGTVIRRNSAREGGGAVFFVVDNNVGTLTIKNSTLHNNPSDEFFTAGFPGIFFHSSGHPIVIDSTLS
jgi:hypothetical protein